MMIKVTLNGKKMNSEESAHQYIKRKLKLREYYGENLDALWDAISTYDQPIEISVINTKYLIKELEGYGASIIEIFQDAEEENSNIIFKII